MEMTGEFRIPAPRERVWQGLNDPEILKQAIPGCQTIEKVSDTEFTAKVVAKVGPVKATFGGKVNLSDLDPPKGYTISGEGSGGVAGFAKGSAKVNLDDDGGTATVLHYEVQAHVGGKLAQIGSRLIDATSRKMAEDFFGRFVAVMSPPAEGDGAAGLPEAGGTAPQVARVALADTAAEPGFQPTTAAAAVSPRLPPAVWVTGLTAIVALMLYYFTRKNGIH
jgi:carbon monoxide dehydrogenase subunit G